MKFFYRIFFILLIVLVFTVPVISFASDNYIRDDREDSLVYSGTVNKSYLSTDTVNGTISVLNPGASVTFKCWGSELYIYGAKYRNSGKFAIYIDNVFVGIFDSGRNEDYVYDVILYSNTGLSDDEHLVSVVCTSDYVVSPYNGQSVSPRVYIDSVVTSAEYVDYYQGIEALLLLLLVVIVFFIFVFKIIETWRYLKIDN